MTLDEQQDFEASTAIELAEKHNLWIDNASILGEVFSSGHENNNYVDYINKIVYKVNNLNNSNTITALFDRIVIHNELFPETRYDFVGFTGNKERLTSIYPVFKQNLIVNSQLADLKEIKTYMESLGFNQTTLESYVNKDYLVFDLYPRNVLKDDAGTIFVVDAEFKKLSESDKKLLLKI